MSTDTKTPGLPGVERRTGDTVFNGMCLLGSLFLLSQMGSQTAWSPGQTFAAQPGFWPRLAVIGMVIFSAWNLEGSLRDPRLAERLVGVGEEIVFWARSLEFGLWFMAYVFATPVIGYLAASILFASALALRAGYRTGLTLWMAALAGLATVVLFKSFLQVKIPAGSIYEGLPDGLRTFFILYL